MRERIVILTLFAACTIASGCTGDSIAGFMAEPDTPRLDSKCSCEESGCHSQIEKIDSVHLISCTDCHGGDGTKASKEESHPTYEPTLQTNFKPEFPLRNKGWNWTGLFDESVKVNGMAELRFLNPGDLRVADVGCGSGNRRAGTTGCHQSVVDRVKLNIHAGMQGDLSQVLYLNGDPLQPDNTSKYAGREAVNPNYDRLTAPLGSIERLERIMPIECLSAADPRLDMNGGDITTVACSRPDGDCCPDGYAFVGRPQPEHMTEGEVVSRMYTNNDCARCHLWNEGSKRTGDMRASGCTACHMKYANDGLSRSADESIDRSVLGRPVKHTFEKAMDDDQCAHCHNRGGRIPQAYYGRRERATGGVNSPQNPVFAEYTSISLLGEGPFSNLHGRVAPFYVEDEDRTNDYDETPPDVHAAAGMACVDCHTEPEAHGDGNIYADRFYEVEITCQTCHGDAEKIADGSTRKGNVHPRLVREGDKIFLTLLLNGERREVSQIKAIIDGTKDGRVNDGCGLKAHNDKLECYACHATWYPNCFHCHVERDDASPERNWTDGLVRIGKLTRDDRKFVSVDTFVLGVNRNDAYLPEGRLAPFVAFGTFNTYKDGTGVVFKDRVPVASDGTSYGVPWNRIHPHTNQTIPRNCDECHRTADMPSDPAVLEDVTCTARPDAAYRDACKKLDRLRVTYGYGSTRYPLAAFLPNPNDPTKDIAIEYVLDRFVGPDRYTINCPDPTNTDDPRCLGPNPVSHDGFRAMSRQEVLRLFDIVVERQPRPDPQYPDKPPLGVLK